MGKRCRAAGVAAALAVFGCGQGGVTGSSPLPVATPTPVVAATPTPAPAASPAPAAPVASLAELKLAPEPGPDGVLVVEPGARLTVNAARVAGAVSLAVAWGDGEKDRVTCGPCRLEHAYAQPGTYDIKVTVETGAAAATADVVAAAEIAGSFTVRVGGSSLDLRATTPTLLPNSTARISGSVAAGCGPGWSLAVSSGDATVSPASGTGAVEATVTARSGGDVVVTGQARGCDAPTRLTIPVPTPAVALAASPTSVIQAQTATVTGTVSGCSSWSLAVASGAGSVSPVSGTGSAISATYTAGTTPGPVTLRATACGTTGDASLSIPAPGVDVVLGASSLNQGSTTSVTGTVSGCSAWSLAVASGAGSVSPTSGSGSAISATYTAGTTPGSVTVRATACSTTDDASLTINTPSLDPPQVSPATPTQDAAATLSAGVAGCNDWTLALTAGNGSLGATSGSGDVSASFTPGLPLGSVTVTASACGEQRTLNFSTTCSNRTIGNTCNATTGQTLCSYAPGPVPSFCKNNPVNSTCPTVKAETCAASCGPCWTNGTSCNGCASCLLTQGSQCCSTYIPTDKAIECDA